ncbi:uncharacterized protein HGUI_03821 [Hanseniaspora guilliermondii]|uniref:UBX domain-containing protein n=1 Tax=Hanseniaspora guilliermondii TaxID=56406 RepID=A0A1L0B719_9ASCO|nr:uncharacterized protein HGUI_03821 [Hanseniaspora guilliermondii]
MQWNTMETFFVKALNSSRIKKKPLIVSLSKSNDVNWLSSWINESNKYIIEKKNACVLIHINPNEIDSQYQSFKRFINGLNNDGHDISDDTNQLVIIHNNEVQFVINDSMDDEEKNDVLKAFVADFVDEVTNVEENNESSADTYREEYLKAKQEDSLERQRLRRLIELDRLEKNNDVKHEVTMSELKENIHTKEKVDDCKLSIKTPENQNIICTFNKNKTLDDVRRFLMDEKNIKREFFFHRVIPKITYKDMDEFKSLEELDLLPRSVLVIEYKSESHQKAYKFFDAKNYGANGIIGSLMNWWHGDSSLHVESEDEEPTKKENRETYNGNTTNLLDPNAKR